MAITLPDDILYLLCSQLWEQRDFGTLFNCALAGRQFAVPALTHVYRMQDVAPVTNGGGDEDQITNFEKSIQAKERRQEQIIAKWAGLWKTMILASMGKTLLPYSKYIRTLNLQDLGELFQDTKFRNKLSSSFFDGEIAHLKVERPSFATKGKKAQLVLDPLPTVNKIGEAITAESPMLEELRGNIAEGALLRWIPKLSHLKNMNLWDGEALRNTGSLVRAHCPSFVALKFWGWMNSDADQAMASFLNDCPPSLKSLEIFSNSMIGPESFLALNCHQETLTELQLRSMSADAVTALNLLKGCTNLVSLHLSESSASTTDLENRHNDVYLEVVAWLRECKRLKSVTLSHFFSAPALLTSLLLEHDINLTELELDDYAMAVGLTFHRALVHQPSLQSLCLKGDGDEPGTNGYSILVDSLCTLKNLNDLRLQNISEYFTDEHICRLAQSLPELEGFTTTGWYITDGVWEDLARLKHLKRLQFNAVTTFTAKGILAYVQGLGYGNQGFALSVMMAEMDSDLKPDEQQLIRDTLTSRVGGTFDFMLLRDPEVSEFENSDSD